MLCAPGSRSLPRLSHLSLILLPPLLTSDRPRSSTPLSPAYNMDAPATPFASFAFKFETPSPSTSEASPCPPHPQPRAKRPRQRSSSFSDKGPLFSYTCTPAHASARGSASATSPERPATPLLPSLPIFSGPKHHLRSTPMKRSPGMQNLNLFTRAAFEEERVGLGLGLDLFPDHHHDYNLPASPEAPMASPAASSVSSSPSLSYFDDEPFTPTSTPSRSRSSSPATPYTPQLSSFESLSTALGLCDSPLASRSNSPSPLQTSLFPSPSIKEGGANESVEYTNEATHGSLGLGIAF